MTSRQWRVLFGAISLGCTLAVAQPPVQEYPVLVAIFVVIAGVAGYIKSPPDISDPAA
jgi:hypothetical protein